MKRDIARYRLTKLRTSKEAVLHRLILEDAPKTTVMKHTTRLDIEALTLAIDMIDAVDKILAEQGK